MKKLLFTLIVFLFVGIHALILPFVHRALLVVPRVYNFPYSDILANYSPVPLQSLANFDGIQYMMIARDGYKYYQQGYFPLYPVVVSGIATLLDGNYLLSGVLVSLVCFLTGIFVFKFYAQSLLNDQAKAFAAVIALLVFPTSFFYLSVYSESMFLLVSTLSLLCMLKKRFWLASIYGFFAALIKVQGVFLVIPFTVAVLALETLKHKKNIGRQLLRNIHRAKWTLLYALSPVLGLFVYCYYLWDQYRDPFLFFHSQSAFGANRSGGELIFLPQVIARYIKIFVTADLSFAYGIALMEFVIFIGVFLVILYDMLQIIREKRTVAQIHLMALYVYSLAILLLPTLTGTLSSIPRYALVSLGFFLAVANRTSVRVQRIGVGAGILLHAVLFILFLKGYFVS